LPKILSLPLSRRATLGGMATASAAWLDPARALASPCLAAVPDPKGAPYEFDLLGKPIEWDYPDGNPVPGGLSLAGLGLQKSSSKKNTNDPGLEDIANLASRFLNKSEVFDWDPASDWSLQFAARGIQALNRDKSIVAANSIEDDYFAFQRLGGVNPCMLRHTTADPDFAHLIADSRNYFSVDYHMLDTLEDNDHVSSDESHGPNDIRRFNYQPKALFRSINGSLEPVAILIKRDAESELVTPKDEAWEIAKFIVQSSDMNYHQLATHLGGTHLYIEPFAVAAGIHLPRDAHPLSRLLRPHFEGMLNINDFATTDLINVCPETEHGGVFDLNFSGTMASNVKFIKEEVFGFYDLDRLRASPSLQMRVKNLFNERMFPRDIVRRGVGHFVLEPIGPVNSGGSPDGALEVLHAAPGPEGGDGLSFDYPYLEDSCRLWNSITDWVGRYVLHYYQSDAAVQGDCALQAWSSAIVRDGKINGFGEYSGNETIEGSISSRSYLVQALTAIIFTSSVQHAAVNFTQSDFGSTLPAGIYRNYFDSDSMAVADYLPNAAHFREVMDTLSILAASQYTTLGKYHENTSNSKRFRSVNQYFSSKEIRSSLKIFRSELEDIEAVILKREKSARFSYKYLMPSRIPQSINV
jgi:arachidonate 15-lipoxygenase